MSRAGGDGRWPGFWWQTSWLQTAWLTPALLTALLVACGGGDAPTGEKVAEASAEAAPQGPVEVESPAPPPPAPALNLYADECLTGELPAGDPELRALTNRCMEHLLETLRAAIGTAEAPQAEVGPRLDEAEVAVRQLTIDIAEQDRPARVRAAALALVALADSLGEVLPGAAGRRESGNQSMQEAREAAEGFDPETPVGQQREALARFLRTADGQVRPLVRELSRPQPATPEPTPQPVGTEPAGA